MNTVNSTLAESFLKKAIEKYPTHSYDYSHVNYVNRSTKIIITCPLHGDFYTTPNNFLAKVKKHGCPTCGLKSKKQRTSQKTSVKAGCETNQFNVRGGTKKYQHLLLQVFE